jgi:ABC-type nickel/cobalt efflux system permease component RcnA
LFKKQTSSNTSIFFDNSIKSMSSRFALFVLVLLLIFGLLFWLLWRRLRTKHDQQLRVLHEAYPRPTFERLRQYLEASVDIRAEPKEKNELADRSSVK